MKSGPRSAVAAIVLSAVAATATSCAPEPAASTPPSFALTSADVVFAEGRPYPINLIFLAKENDPIWTELTGVELPDDASVGPGQFEIIRGEGSDGYQLGNIAFEIDVPADGISFDSVGLVYKNATEPVPTDVGSWTLSEAPLDDFATADAKAEVAAMGGCSSADLPVPDTAASVDSFVTGSDDVQVEDVVLNPDESIISITLTCTDDADFYVISPTLDYTDDAGAAQSTRLTPIAIGFQDIDDADLKRIRKR